MEWYIVTLKFNDGMMLIYRTKANYLEEVEEKIQKFIDHKEFNCIVDSIICLETIDEIE